MQTWMLKNDNGNRSNAKATQCVPFDSNYRITLAKINMHNNQLNLISILIGKTTLDIPFACITNWLGIKIIGFIDTLI